MVERSATRGARVVYDGHPLTMPPLISCFASQVFPAAEGALMPNIGVSNEDRIGLYYILVFDLSNRHSNLQSVPGGFDVVAKSRERLDEQSRRKTDYRLNITFCVVNERARPTLYAVRSRFVAPIICG